jgi:hypothetical protein
LAGFIVLPRAEMVRRKPGGKTQDASEVEVKNE